MDYIRSEVSWSPTAVPLERPDVILGQLVTTPLVTSTSRTLWHGPRRRVIATNWRGGDGYRNDKRLIKCFIRRGTRGERRLYHASWPPAPASQLIVVIVVTRHSWSQIWLRHLSFRPFNKPAATITIAISSRFNRIKALLNRYDFYKHRVTKQLRCKYAVCLTTTRVLVL